MKFLQLIIEILGLNALKVASSICHHEDNPITCYWEDKGAPSSFARCLNVSPPPTNVPITNKVIVSSLLIINLHHATGIDIRNLCSSVRILLPILVLTYIIIANIFVIGLKRTGLILFLTIQLPLLLEAFFLEIITLAICIALTSTQIRKPGPVSWILIWVLTAVTALFVASYLNRVMNPTQWDAIKVIGITNTLIIGTFLLWISINSIMVTILEIIVRKKRRGLN